jgi:hypothetical protein
MQMRNKGTFLMIQKAPSSSRKEKGRSGDSNLRFTPLWVIISVCAGFVNENKAFHAFAGAVSGPFIMSPPAVS